MCDTVILSATKWSRKISNNCILRDSSLHNASQNFILNDRVILLF
ncbi:hypothetical protein SAMN05421785_10968 [Chryseobacterium gambrini]|uniref:Uncharacterized protein n=1 Tax=Chryseobacterium gambrini TaxID=373672 RepID=A0A1N7Q5T9_9FLAO|nr:hypothetical protein SAMN05421785_10968 [Chryseobacterium gambrini]